MTTWPCARIPDTLRPISAPTASGGSAVVLIGYAKPSGACWMVAPLRLTRAMPTLAPRPRAHAPRTFSIAEIARAPTSGDSAFDR